MNEKNFQQYLEKRLDKSEIAEIEKMAKLEISSMLKSFTINLLQSKKK